MANLPKQIEQRNELDCRLGVKSSLSNIASVVALAYVLYCANEKNSEIVYAEEVQQPNGKMKLILKTTYKKWIIENFAVKEEILNENPLLTSQLESLQVGLALMFRLAKISYVDYPNVDTKERTGGKRFRKLLKFAINTKLVDVFLSAWDEEEVKTEIANWLNNNPSNSKLSQGLKQMLTSFAEETQFKIRNRGQEIIFQQEGIYQAVSSANTVIGKDDQEDVGPFRVLKSFVKEGLHPFLSLGNNEFSSYDSVEFLNYKKMVSTGLGLLPKRTIIYEEIPEIKSLNENTGIDSRQIIFYGAPGTGKSHEVKRITGECDDEGRENVFRTTFHPDTDYATFVGCYKPTMRDTGQVRIVEGKTEKVEEISYEFVPQTFTDAYVYAYLHPDTPTYLVIEEINRGNCAQIFGDLFQLLDRKENGTSEYRIKADTDLAKHLINKGVASGDAKDVKLSLPANLHILATMNTSDQSLFPMDSAFKRRWDWEYVPISYTEEKSSAFEIEIGGEKYSWVKFIEMANKRIFDLTQSEDKQMGNFFIKSSVDERQFKSKVMFYLWNEVLRDEVENQKYFFYATDEDGTKSKFTFKDLYEDDAAKTLQGFMRYLTADLHR